MFNKLKKIVFIIFCISVSFLIIFSLYFRICVVSGSSMNPTLKNGEKLVIQKSKNIKRNQIIVFKDYEKNYMLIKRVIAKEGDHLKIKNDKVFLNGEILKESYIKEKCFEGDIDLFIPKGEFFVMGDNRNNSRDSRSFGCVNKSQIIGFVKNDALIPWLKPWAFSP